METHFHTHDQAILWKRENETLRVEPWGPDAVRVRAALHPDFASIPSALLDAPAGAQPEIRLDAEQAVLVNGRIRVEISQAGRLRFFNSASGDVLLEEPVRMFYHPAPRSFKAKSSDLFELEATFKSQPGERIYGLGQHQHGLLDHKGCVIDLEQRNTEVCIPFCSPAAATASCGTTPASGGWSWAKTAPAGCWRPPASIDYYIVAGDTPAEILEKYVDATGHAAAAARVGAGLLAVQAALPHPGGAAGGGARVQAARAAAGGDRLGLLPLAHDGRLGSSTRDDWPDPAGMMRELKEMGVELMVSIWPTVNPINPDYAEMEERGLLVAAERGVQAHMDIWDHDPEKGRSMVAYYDADQPRGARVHLGAGPQELLRPGRCACPLAGCRRAGDDPMHPENLRYAAGQRAGGQQHLPAAAPAGFL